MRDEHYLPLHGYHKGMSKAWEPIDRPKPIPIKTKTVVHLSPTGRRYKVTVKI